MANTLCKKAATVSFWDGYAPWYKLWMDHNRYHNRIIEVLTTMVEPGWRVLIESSFAYHTMDEVFEHWAFKKGSPLCPDEKVDIKSRLIFEDNHLWIKDTAYVGMYWWSRDGRNS